MFSSRFSRKLPHDIQSLAERILIHPGEILLEEFLKLMSISQYRLAKDIGVPAMRISKIVRGQRGISADTALRLARYFDMPVEFWTGIQTHYAVELAKMALSDRVWRKK